VSLKLLWVLLQKFCVYWIPHQFMLEIKRAGLEICQQLVSCFLALDTRVMILCVALSQVTRGECVSVTGNLKTQSLEYHHPTSSRKKNSRLNLLLENACSFIFWATEAYSQGVHGQGMRAIRG
jgi:hypothetical protein